MNLRSSSARRSSGSDAGATAVEFVLVLPLLFTLLMGIIEYGMWLTDSVGLRHGARETARAGTVSRWGTGPCERDPLPGASANLQTLACTAEQVTPRTTGRLALRLVVLDPAGQPTTRWATGNTLRVCMLTQHRPLSALPLLPREGLIRSRIDMAIERAEDGQQEIGGEDAPPPGASWDWCR